jgi:WW domain
MSYPASFLVQLSIEPLYDSDILFIPVLAWQQSLPPRWKVLLDSSCNEYYYVNSDEGVSQWDHPFLPYIRQLIQIARLLRPLPDFPPSMLESIRNQLKSELDAELVSWLGPFPTETNQTYYVNSNKNSSSWEDPRVDADLIFDLQVKILCELARIKQTGRMPLPSSLTGIKIPPKEKDSYLSQKPDIGSETATPTFGQSMTSPMMSGPPSPLHSIMKPSF